jgi:site-specific DNA recombinase
MKQTAAYYRSSTKLQEESVNTQQFNVTQFALAKGYFIDKEYQDPYVSARKNTLNERPKMNELIQDIKKGKIERLLVYKRDRLARKIEEHLLLYYLFKDYNVEVIFVAENEPAMQFNIFGELMELFIGVMNQREGEQILERIKDAKLNSFLTGAKHGNLPFGYEVVDNQISKKEKELEVVADIFKDWNTNEYNNLGDFERELQAKGVKRGTANWTRQNLEDALTNPIYMGMRVATFKDQEQKRFINDINCIEPEDFYKAQELLVERTRKNQKRQPFLYLLSGLLYCQKCAEKNNGVLGNAEQSNQSENTDESTSEQSNKSVNTDEKHC